MSALMLLRQMVVEAAVIALALAFIVAFIFFGSGVWSVGPQEVGPWSKPSIYSPAMIR
jgi:hypothetical protein